MELIPLNIHSSIKKISSKPIPIELGGLKCFNCNIPRHELFINYYCGEDWCKRCCKRNFVHYEHDQQCNECKDIFAPPNICVHCNLCFMYCCACQGRTVVKLKFVEPHTDYEEIDSLNDELGLVKFKKNK